MTKRTNIAVGFALVALTIASVGVVLAKHPSCNRTEPAPAEPEAPVGAP
jgi:hypothetical protein